MNPSPSQRGVNRLHHLGEYPWSNVQAEWKDPKLVGDSACRERQIGTVPLVYLDMPVRILHVYRCHETPPRKGPAHLRHRGHSESKRRHEAVEVADIENQTRSAGVLLGYLEQAVEMIGTRRRFDNTILEQTLYPGENGWLGQT